MTFAFNPLKWFFDPKKAVPIQPQIELKDVAPLQPGSCVIVGPETSQSAISAWLQSKSAKAVESDMNFGAILALILKLAPVTVLTIQKVVGDAQSGADKKTMAQDALSGATAAALSVLPGEQSIYAQLASAVASEAIDATVAFTKVTGAYQKATADAKALQASVSTAAK